jgi:hypothetical protein
VFITCEKERFKAFAGTANQDEIFRSSHSENTRCSDAFNHSGKMEEEKLTYKTWFMLTGTEQVTEKITIYNVINTVVC